MTVARRLLRNSLILLVIGIVATIHGLVVGSPETPPGEMAPQLMLGIWFIFIGCVMALISGLVIRNKKKKGEL
ncbi:hypothetical protein GRAQ_01546 [Rahnella aquatilis CIP 78.65 = ATCC 33071]|nr:hypothetical protein GRAQ_01546 [Rahnella aquatilis CIP 78.65 = ATCC 33071]